MDYLTVEQLYPECEVLVMFRNGLSDSNTWGDFYVPVKITKEFKNFFICETMPHRNKKGSLVADPYRITLDKFEIKRGNILVKPN